MQQRATFEFRRSFKYRFEFRVRSSEFWQRRSKSEVCDFVFEEMKSISEITGRLARGKPTRLPLSSLRSKRRHRFSTT